MREHIDFSHDLLDVQTVELDVANPRVAQYIEMYGGDITAEQMKRVEERLRISEIERAAKIADG